MYGSQTLGAKGVGEEMFQVEFVVVAEGLRGHLESGELWDFGAFHAQGDDGSCGGGV